MTDSIVVFNTCGSAEEADVIARMLVERHLAACVNILPPVRSIYRWQERIEESTEWLLLIKTAQSRFAELSEALRAAHSYEVPEIMALPVLEGSPAYLAWLTAETNA